jgi:hypothetical protein
MPTYGSGCKIDWRAREIALRKAADRIVAKGVMRGSQKFYTLMHRYGF